ncbi:uncharacterized protein LOC133316476 [Gastrolobium bilobum]|uniref:uncharacterized protein LOC133316476 n=1 Tax=Gastrolobium bilobum TaxID=150636 RepID=UPI002AB1FD25|nr:uncharacterized protein LOC133316476 [Gastrolobium bilobum]
MLSCPSVLTKSKSSEILYLYVGVGTKAISATLIRESKEDSQRPVYFVSKVLQEAELQYQQVEKVALTLIIVARRLRPYFQCHPIIVRTNRPIRQILHKPDLAGRMMSWAIELSEYQLSYKPRAAIKAQSLTDFIAEMTYAAKLTDCTVDAQLPAFWRLFVNASSNAKGSSVGIIIENPDGIAVEHSLSFNFNTTNQAEYEAIVAGLLQAKKLGEQHLKVFNDSQLVTFQISGEYHAKGPLMSKYLENVNGLMESFNVVEVEHIRRSENTRANILAKLASTKSPGNNRVVVQQNLPNPCIIMSISDVAIEIAKESWTMPIINYLSKGTLPLDQNEAKKIVGRSDHFYIVQGLLYKSGLSTSLLKCLN